MLGIESWVMGVYDSRDRPGFQQLVLRDVNNVEIFFVAGHGAAEKGTFCGGQIDGAGSQQKTADGLSC